MKPHYEIISTDPDKNRWHVLKGLEALVNNAIDAGFTPIGGVGVESTKEGVALYQAMVMENDDNSNKPARYIGNPPITKCFECGELILIVSNHDYECSGCGQRYSNI